MKSENPYAAFLKTPSRTQWERIGLDRRSGVAVPLFSLHSSKSIGIGEIPDLKHLIDWCRSVKMSLIQLLPLNDVGFDFRPYDAQSTFALDPMYLSLTELGVQKNHFKREIEALRKRFSVRGPQVNYEIKPAKLDLLGKIFDADSPEDNPGFQKFLRQNSYWIDDYALFKVLKERHEHHGWQQWPEPVRQRDPAALEEWRKREPKRILFFKWLQWQLFEQLRKVKKYGCSKNVFLIGDLPFLVSSDSADVWSHQDYFKLDWAGGAPPDLYYAGGQRWGMPAYRWEAIAGHGYDYLIQKLRFAENFYDLFRMDHIIGVFRLWTIPVTEPVENRGSNGHFDPPAETAWEEHGRKILSVIAQNTRMLCCGEDLGTVPPCSGKVLEEFGICGTDVQRWKRDWGKSNEFLDPAVYRKNSMVMVSTHDSSTLRGWWLFEAGTVDAMFFQRECGKAGIAFDSVRNALFDLNDSHPERLRWRPEIDTLEKFLKIIGRTETEAAVPADAFKTSRWEKPQFLRFLALENENAKKLSPDLIRNSLSRAAETSAIFNVHLLIDWLSLSPEFDPDPWQFRINFPGTLSPRNWSLTLPCPLEKLARLGINEEIKKMNTWTRRT